MWNRIAASDPGLLRLQSSFRGLVAGLITANLFYIVSVYTDLSFARFFPGIYFAVLSAVFTNDADLRSQKWTLLYSFLAAVFVFLLGTGLSNSPVLMTCAFTGIIFIATYIRKFGPRWNTVGAISFTIFFLALYSRTPLNHVPLAIGTLAVGGLISYVVRFGILRSHRVRILERMLRAYRTQLLMVLNQEHSRDGQFDESKSRQRLDADLSNLNEAALSLDENYARVGCAENPEALRALQKIREVIFEIETRIELTAHGTLESTMKSVEPLTAIKDRASKQKAFIQKAYLALVELTEALIASGASMPLPVQGQAPQQNPKHAFRLACQAGVASLIATLVGRSISTSHWYWTVISAYVVFVRTKSFADTNTRAWQRVVGTLIGAALGLLIAEEAQLKYVGLGVMAVAIFIAYYFLKPAYMVMVVFMTIFLAELYEVTGQFSFSVLALRVGLTLVGALIGVATARLVFPLRPHEQIEASLDASKRSLETVQTLLQRPKPAPQELAQFRSQLLDAIRNFDRDLRMTRATAQAGRERAVIQEVAAMLEEGTRIRAVTANVMRSYEA